jgi:hypothetical protein
LCSNHPAIFAKTLTEIGHYYLVKRKFQKMKLLNCIILRELGSYQDDYLRSENIEAELQSSKSLVSDIFLI